MFRPWVYTETRDYPEKNSVGDASTEWEDSQGEAKDKEGYQERGNRNASQGQQGNEETEQTVSKREKRNETKRTTQATGEFFLRKRVLCGTAFLKK